MRKNLLPCRPMGPLLILAALCGAPAASAGWPVTSEEPLGALIAVSFMAGFRSMTSGACIMTGGRIGFFGGVDLLALATAPQPDGTATGHLRRPGADRLPSGAARCCRDRSPTSCWPRTRP